MPGTLEANMTTRPRPLFAALALILTLFTPLPTRCEGAALIVPSVGDAALASETPSPEATATPLPMDTPLPTPTPSPTGVPDEMTFSASLTPDALAAPGEAVVRIRMQNAGGFAADELYVLSSSGATLAGPISVKPGTSDVWRGTVAVSASELSEGRLLLHVKYVLALGDAGERAVERELNVPIQKIEAQPQLEFTRELSSNYVEYGEELTVTYRLKNAGNVKLTDIAVSDSLFGGVLERVSSLDVGKKRTITRRVVVKRRLVSKATAACSYVGGSDQLRVSRGASTIYLADVKLDLALDADKSTVASGDMVTLRLTLVNNGNVPFSRLHVEDAVFGDLGWLDGQLQPGESCTVTKAVNLKSTTTFQFSVSGSCGTGAQLNAKSNELTVFVQPMAAEIKLRIRAEADRTSLDAPGQVKFTLHVYNEGGIELRNVQLLEMVRGTIRSLLFVPAGETPPLEQDYEVSESGTFRFIARTTDAEGVGISAISDPIEISVLPPETAPTEPPEAPAKTASWKPKGNRVVAALAIATGLMVAMTALLIVGYVRDFRTRRMTRRGVKWAERKRR